MFAPRRGAIAPLRTAVCQCGKISRLGGYSGAGEGEDKTKSQGLMKPRSEMMRFVSTRVVLASCHDAGRNDPGMKQGHKKRNGQKYGWHHLHG